MTMQAIQTNEGVILGAWLFTSEGPPVYRGLKYLEMHFKRSDVVRGETDYENETLTREQNISACEILMDLGR